VRDVEAVDGGHAVTEEQFAVWLQGYLTVNVFNCFNGVGGKIIDVTKTGADVLAAARSVVSSTPPETGS
jgi:hypothetical protein